MKCEKCGQENSLWPKSLAERIATLKSKAADAGDDNAVELMAIIEELEKRPSVNFFPTPNPGVGVAPSIPWTPQPTIPTAPSWPIYPNPLYPTIVCGGNTSVSPKGVVAVNNDSSTIPDATGDSSSKPRTASQWEGPDTYGG